MYYTSQYWTKSILITHHYSFSLPLPLSPYRKKTPTSYLLPNHPLKSGQNTSKEKKEQYSVFTKTPTSKPIRTSKTLTTRKHPQEQTPTLKVSKRITTLIILLCIIYLTGRRIWRSKKSSRICHLLSFFPSFYSIPRYLSMTKYA